MLTDYAGTNARKHPDRGGLELGPNWAYAPKYDGCYARIATDRSGRIVSIISRGGTSLADFSSGLVGMRIGLRDSVIHGELEAITEASVRASAARGWPALHLFDATRLLGRPIASLPFSERYASLHRWQAEVECYGEIDRANWWETDDNGRAHDPVDKRFVKSIPRNLRRLPIAPLARGKAGAEQMWQSLVVRGEGDAPVEGLVAVRLDAPLGARSAKAKIKATDTIDAVVVRQEKAGVDLLYRGHTFVVSLRGKLAHELAALPSGPVGAVVEVAHNGWYERSVTPRFARLVRIRHDLMPAVLH